MLPIKGTIITINVRQYDLDRQTLPSSLADAWGLIKGSLQAVVYSVTIGVGSNPATKNRRWMTRKRFFHWTDPHCLRRMPEHFYICRPHFLADREMRSTFT